jgi:hypothetical protein
MPHYVRQRFLLCFFDIYGTAHGAHPGGLSKPITYYSLSWYALPVTTLTAVEYKKFAKLFEVVRLNQCDGVVNALALIE